ncbi:MAG: multicopper oxidase domain-containing protein, partial [Candidatus Kapaibacterium sp.]
GVIPSQLPAIVKYQEADITNTRIWTFAAIHHVNDLPFDMNRIDANVPFNMLEKWTFISEAENTHPIHVHGAQFQVLDRDGKLPDPAETGWKDVVRIDPVGKVNVLLKFDAYEGLFLIHCHKLEHADMGMMANFTVGTEGVDNQKPVLPAIDISPNPASSYAMLSFVTLQQDELLLIIDEKGAVILRELLSAGSDKYEVDASHLSAGSYQILLGKQRANLVVVK